MNSDFDLIFFFSKSPRSDEMPHKMKLPRDGLHDDETIKSEKIKRKTEKKRKEGGTSFIVIVQEQTHTPFQQ